MKKSLQSRINRIKDKIFTEAIPLDGWKSWVTDYENVSVQSSYQESISETIGIGESWKADYGTLRCFCRSVRIPAEFRDKKIILDLDFGGEGIVSVDGEYVTGISSSFSALYVGKMVRSRVLLSEKHLNKSEIEVFVETGLHFFDKYVEYHYEDREFSVATESRKSVNSVYTVNRAVLAAVDTVVEDYYFNASAVYLVLERLSSQGGLYSKLLAALGYSLDIVDFYCSREEFVKSVVKADVALKREMEHISWATDAKVLLTGHCHLDIAWLWPLKVAIRKCSRSFSNALALMEQYPEYYLTQSQPQLYSFTKKHYPEIYKGIKNRIKEGKWIPVGNMWVEPEINMPSGEALVRQLLYGRQFYMKEFGISSEIAWLPDSFGFCGSLPQILKKSGIRYFMTTKLNINDTNEFPYSMFQWMGIDGSKVLAYYQSIDYSGEIIPKYLGDAWDKFKEKSILGMPMGTYGYGDGGGGPTYEMLEYAKRYEGFPGLPEIKLGSPAEFFENAERYFDDYPVWNDELYLENHRGTYTSQAKTKLLNRKSELIFRSAEIAASIATVFGFQYPFEKLLEGWKKILLNQDHDIISGCSIKEVHNECIEDYIKSIAIGEEIESKALEVLIERIDFRVSGNYIAVFNYLSWARTDIVDVVCKSDVGSLSIIDHSGATIPSIVEDDGTRIFKVRFEAENIPPMGYRIYKINSSENLSKKSSISVTKECMENDYFRLKFNNNGEITSLFDKRYQREVLCDRGRGNILQVFDDRPSQYNAWNIEQNYVNSKSEVSDECIVEVVECNPVRGILRIDKSYNLSTITQEIIIYASIPRIDFRTEVDWKETEKMLKAAFETDILASRATYEIAFGSIERPTHRNTSWDQARFEVPAHRWADISEPDYGVSILNDCKYGYDTKENVIRITLLRSPVFPDPDADKGIHNFIYSLYPHGGDWRGGGTVQAAHALNMPLKVVPVFREKLNNGDLSADMSFFSVEGSYMVLDAIKKAEDGKGIIMRLYESQGRKGRVKVKSFFEILTAAECNLMEEEGVIISADKYSFSFDVKPYEIRTFRLIVKNKT